MPVSNIYSRKLGGTVGWTLGSSQKLLQKVAVLIAYNTFTRKVLMYRIAHFGLQNVAI